MQNVCSKQWIKTTFRYDGQTSGALVITFKENQLIERSQNDPSNRLAQNMKQLIYQTSILSQPEWINYCVKQRRHREYTRQWRILKIELAITQVGSWLQLFETKYNKNFGFHMEAIRLTISEFSVFRTNFHRIALSNDSNTYAIKYLFTSVPLSPKRQSTCLNGPLQLLDVSHRI